MGIVEVFAGVGSVARGFARTGRFEIVLLTDIDAAARDTLLENQADVTYLRRDIRWLRPSHILDQAGGRPIDGLLGCPPCQGFSAAGNRDGADPRNALLAHFFRLVKSLRPKFFVMENVPRVFDSELLTDRLDTVGREYRVWKGVLNAALYGAPQTRQRAIVIGYRKDLEVEPLPPPPTHFGTRQIFDYRLRRLTSLREESAGSILGTYPDVEEGEPTDLGQMDLRSLSDLVVVGDALGDLPPASDHDDPVPVTAPASTYARPLQGRQAANHRRWRHRPELLARLRGVLPGHGLLDHHGRRQSRPYYSQAYSRLHRRGLARTITTNFHNPGSGRFLHYADVRSITVREAARLQGVEDSFVFLGSPTTQERLVGNAFPAPLAEALAKKIGIDLAGRL
jgi:DNA (cytosine-5)-methyltransferase 1